MTLTVPAARPMTGRQKLAIVFMAVGPEVTADWEYHCEKGYFYKASDEEMSFTVLLGLKACPKKRFWRRIFRSSPGADPL